MRETQVRSLGREDPLEKEIETHCSTLGWKIPWKEEPGGLKSMGSQESDITEQLHFLSLIFMAALFTTSKIWKLPKCPKCLSTDEWIKYMLYIYRHTRCGNLLSHKREWNFSICSNMNGLGGYYDNWNKSEKDRYFMIACICGI